MNEEQLRTLAGLLTTLNNFNNGEGDTLNLKVTSFTVDSDGGTATVLYNEEEGMYLSI